MRKFIFGLFLVALNMANAQERPSYILKNTSCQHFIGDIQDNIYIWEGYSLNKYNAQGELLFQYSNPALGDIQFVNADNPLKIMLFYADAGMVVFVDSKLAPLGSMLNLFEHNLNTISLVTFASPNRLILFDNSNQELIITDLDLNIINKTHCTFDHFAPTQLQVVKGKTIILNNPTDGVYLFDIFGTFDKRISLPNIQYLQFIGNHLFYLESQQLWQYNTLKLERTAVAAPDRLPIKQFYATPSAFWILTQEGIYALTENNISQ